MALDEVRRRLNELMPQKKAYTYKDGPYRSPRPVRTLSWSVLGESSMHAFVVKCTDLGYTVCLSRTQDGASLSLTVLAGNEKIKEYIGPNDDVLNVINSIVEYIEG